MSDEYFLTFKRNLIPIGRFLLMLDEYFLTFELNFIPLGRFILTLDELSTRRVYAPPPPAVKCELRKCNRQDEIFYSLCSILEVLSVLSIKQQRPDRKSGRDVSEPWMANIHRLRYV